MRRGKARKFGWYSALMEREYGSVVWKTCRGHEAIVTLVTTSRNRPALKRIYPDWVFMGRLQTFVRSAFLGTDTTLDQIGWRERALKQWAQENNR
jgi:hypothetical protein